MRGFCALGSTSAVISGHLFFVHKCTEIANFIFNELVLAVYGANLLEIYCAIIFKMKVTRVTEKGIGIIVKILRMLKK